jgi:putative ABC transport system substrate-binding protein
MWPVRARAQQASLPVIGFLNPASPEGWSADRLRGFRQGLKETGFVEGENVAIDYRWANNQLDRLPALAAELARRKVAVIVTTAPPSASAAKAATTAIPIVFVLAEDPVRLGLVASLARPDGNLTGVNFLSAELAAKRLELLREAVVGATRVAVLVNPANTTITQSALRDLEPAARAMGLKVQILEASNSRDINAAFDSRDINAAFATFAQARPDALFVNGDAFFGSRIVQLVNLASRHAIPTIFALREYTQAGGLMSYGADLADAFREAGVYAGRILKSVNIADLPVLQSSKFELVINAETARMLGLTIPPALLARADEVIE